MTSSHFMQFLCNVITSAVKRIADEKDPVDSKEWIDTCVDMATELMVDKHQIQLFVIETMFSFALDRFAHEVSDVIIAFFSRYFFINRSWTLFRFLNLQLLIL